MEGSPLAIGDLVLLSRFGLSVVKPNPAKLGVVIGGPYKKTYICAKSGLYTKYLSYDVMLGQELLKEVPEDFVLRMGDDEHEENPRGLEEALKRDDEK